MSWHAGTAFDPAGNGNGNILHQSPGSQHISPVSGSPPAAPPAAAFGDRKRKRGSEIDEIATPVGELGGNGYGPRRTLSLDADLANSSPMTGRPKHQPGVKRACNDCRQQKVRMRQWKDRASNSHSYTDRDLAPMQRCRGPGRAVQTM